MNNALRAQSIFDKLDDVAQSEGYQLIDVEVKGQAHNPIVVIFLDQDAGIGIDALAKANYWISNILDELIDTRYTLEVSSPGGRVRRSANLADERTL